MSPRNCWLLAAVLLAGMWPPNAVSAQQRALSQGDRVRVKQILGGRQEGVLHSVASDTLYLQGPGNSPPIAFPKEMFADSTYTLWVAGGSKAGWGAFSGGLVFGLIGFGEAVCGERGAGQGIGPFVNRPCTGGLGAGLLNGVGFGGLGALVGLVIGSRFKPYKRVRPEDWEAGPESQFAPVLGLGGRFGMSARVMLGSE